MDFEKLIQPGKVGINYHGDLCRVICITSMSDIRDFLKVLSPDKEQVEGFLSAFDCNTDGYSEDDLFYWTEIIGGEDEDVEERIGDKNYYPVEYDLKGYWGLSGVVYKAQDSNGYALLSEAANKLDHATSTDIKICERITKLRCDLEDIREDMRDKHLVKIIKKGD